MATTTNYGWAEPDNTSLVKNGAQDIRILGDAIDASVWNIGYGQAGKNKIINGDFGIWQRGTSFSNPSTTTYNADRWLVEQDGSGATRTVSQQTFTPGAAPVAGYESQYFLRYAVSGGTSNTFQQIEQRIEDVRTFAGNPVTFSFWAKGDAARTINILINRNFGSGGSAADQSSVGSTLNITTSWARYSVTATMASVTGKTIGAGSYAQWILRFAAATAQTIDIWGVQLEYGSTATPFETASGGSPQAELAMCQRYYFRRMAEGTNSVLSEFGGALSATSCRITVNPPVTMRVIPTSTDYTALTLYDAALNSFAATGVTINSGISNKSLIYIAVDSSGLTQYRNYQVITSSSSGYLGFSAEL
jgi:hypothetical protein